MKKVSFALLFVAASYMSAVAQEPLKLPALSPSAKITQEFSTSNIEITYSRPSARGRDVMGEVVAYDRPWRTGANAPTRIKFGEEVMVAGKDVKAGEYALYTIPGKSQWEVILSKASTSWGPKGFDTQDDVARFMVKPTTLPNEVETFTINVSNITFNTANIDLMWEKTKVSIPVKVNNDERLMASIDKAINKPNIPYFQAANYYYETGKNLNLAMEYVNKALATNPNAFYMYNLKARIAQKQGNKEEAIAAARQSMELAKGTANEEEYKRNGEKIIKAVSKR